VQRIIEAQSGLPS